LKIHLLVQLLLVLGRDVSRGYVDQQWLDVQLLG
jgi:hypothetical protein